MQKTLDDSRRQLSETIRSAILHLTSLGYTYKQIGMHMGYPESTAKCHVSQCVNEGKIPPGFELMKLSQFASAEGFDALADHFSAPAKMTIPSTAGEATPNLSLLEENQAISIAVGRGLEAFSQADVTAASQALRESLAAHFDAFREVQALAEARGDGQCTLMPKLMAT